MPKRGNEYLDSWQKRRLEAVARYAFTVIAIPKAREFEARAKQELGTDGDGIYKSLRVGKGGQLFWFLKSESLIPDHPEAQKTNGSINGAATAFTQDGRNQASDEWRQWMNLYAAVDAHKPLEQQNPLRRNYKRQGELYVVSGYRPETSADVEQVNGLTNVPARQMDIVKRGRSQYLPGAACESGAWRHQFETGRTDEVLAASLALEADYFTNATLEGDIEFMATISKRLADFSSDMVGKDPKAIQERIEETSHNPRYTSVAF